MENFLSEETVLFGLKCWVGGICHEYEKDASLRENVKERSQVHKSVQHVSPFRISRPEP